MDEGKLTPAESLQEVKLVGSSLVPGSGYMQADWGAHSSKASDHTLVVLPDGLVAPVTMSPW